MTTAATGLPDRFTTPLYTVTEAARYLDVPASTLATWTHGYRMNAPGRREVVGAPILTALPKAAGRGPGIPFVGLAEGLVLTAMRKSGVPLQRVRPALTRLERELGLAHALASQKLYTDGAEVLFDYSERGDDPAAAKAARAGGGPQGPARLQRDRRGLPATARLRSRRLRPADRTLSEEYGAPADEGPGFEALTCDNGSKVWMLTRRPSCPSLPVGGAPARLRRSASHLQPRTTRRQQRFAAGGRS